ncbi:MAG TPA: hypothetical protein VIM61_00415 [Chthoniobacterales bacterium]
MKTLADHRAAICRACPAPCEARRAGSLDFGGPLETCPLNRWRLAPPAEILTPPLPGIPERTATFARQLVAEAGATVKGQRPPSSAEAARRLEICQSDRCGQYRQADKTCAACGCFLPRKVTWRSTACPRGLW